MSRVGAAFVILNPYGEVRDRTLGPERCATQTLSGFLNSSRSSSQRCVGAYTVWTTCVLLHGGDGGSMLLNTSAYSGS